MATADDAVNGRSLGARDAAVASTDPLGLRDDAPLFDGYLRALERSRTPFTIPGHKGRTDLVGGIVAADVPLHGGVDTIRLDAGLLLDAERRAAELWGADHARFSVGGSTHGNQALALAAGRPGDRVVVSRTLHRSMLSGLALAGLEPVWIRPWVDPDTGLPGGVEPDRLDVTLERHRDVRVVFIGDPSYVGGVGDVAALAEVAHRHDAALVVDAAWAAHFGFHPALPDHALELGADALVTSAHKTLPAWSQAALVLTRGERFDRDRVDRAFETTHTTSPAGAVLASIDAARALLAAHGERLLGDLVALVADARRHLSSLPGVRVLDGDWVDPSKLVILLDPRPTPDGFELERTLLAHGAPIELTDRGMLVPMVTIADTAETIGRLVELIARAVTAGAGAGSTGPATRTPDTTFDDRFGPRAASIWSIEPEQVMSPRDAAFATHEAVDADDAVGRVAAEIIAPYPPGIPVVAPGERITAAALGILRDARDHGARIAYAADPTLARIHVIANTAAPDQTETVTEAER